LISPLTRITQGWPVYEIETLVPGTSRPTDSTDRITLLQQMRSIFGPTGREQLLCPSPIVQSQLHVKIDLLSAIHL
jgi:hypothetical protein